MPLWWLNVRWRDGKDDRKEHWAHVWRRQAEQKTRLPWLVKTWLLDGEAHHCQVGLAGWYSAAWSSTPFPPQCTAQSQNCPGSKQDGWKGEWYIFWIWTPQKTSMVLAATGIMLVSGTMLVSVVHATVRVLCWCSRSMLCMQSVLRPYWCLWSVLLNEAISMSIFHVATNGWVDVHGLCCYQRPCWGPWFSIAIWGPC